MIDIGWFSTGRGEGSLGLLQTVQDAILRGELDARIRFIFSNREAGEGEGSDRFFRQARDYDIPLVTFSSQGFRRSMGGGPFSRHRLEFDREVMKQLEDYEPDMCVLAGYMLITDTELCNRYTMLNFHPAPPNGPVGTWQDVIWRLIEDGAEEAGGYIHLATEDLDRGPVLTWYSFPIRGKDFDPLWQQIPNLSMEELFTSQGERFPLYPTPGQSSDHYQREIDRLTMEFFKTSRGENFPQFPGTGQSSDHYQRELDRLITEFFKTSYGENLPLLQLIRQEGVRRERPLLLETLKAFAQGDIRVKGRRVLDGSGNPSDGLCLNEAIERSMQSNE